MSLNYNTAPPLLRVVEGGKMIEDWHSCPFCEDGYRYCGGLIGIAPCDECAGTWLNLLGAIMLGVTAPPLDVIEWVRGCA